MKQVFGYLSLLLLSVLGVSTTSCSGSYKIKGTSDVSLLDGQKLYLQSFKEDDFQSIDSCDIVHGEFTFSGSVDSTKVALLTTSDGVIMPLILEEGELKVSLNTAQQKVEGSPLNDKLMAFVNTFNQIEDDFSELSHRQSEAIMDGLNEDSVNARLNLEAGKIAERKDSLITKVICDNFDNVLSSAIFMLVTSDMNVPQLTPWIEDIMSKASDMFKNDAYVKDFMEKAQHNESVMNGTAGDTQAPLPATPADTPTPNDLAQPAKE